MLSTRNLGVALNVQCERCKVIRSFTANLLHERIDNEGFLVDQKSVFSALIALGWYYWDGHWYCCEGHKQELAEILAGVFAPVKPLPKTLTVSEALRLPDVREGKRHIIWKRDSITCRIDKIDGTLRARWWCEQEENWALTGSAGVAVLIADLDVECYLVDPSEE